jgi:hypothetical protein
MPCQQCEDGKWRWGSGPCEYDSKEECEAAHQGEHEAETARTDDEEEQK